MFRIDSSDPSHCMPTPPPKYEGFRNLNSVPLVGVIINTDIIWAQLTNLYMQRCSVIEHLVSNLTSGAINYDMGIFHRGTLIIFFWQIREPCA